MALTNAFVWNVIRSIGLGAEDLNDLVAQRRLAPTERKMKYRLEASEKLKQEREKETLAMAKKLEDDIFDNDSKTVQASKKRSRAFSKNAVADMHATAKKKVKLETRAAAPVVESIVSAEVHQTEEVVFDFTKSSEPETPVKVERKPEKSADDKKHAKPKDSPKKHHGKDKKDTKEKKDHKKSHKK